MKNIRHCPARIVVGLGAVVLAVSGTLTGLAWVGPWSSSVARAAPATTPPSTKPFNIARTFSLIADPTPAGNPIQHDLFKIGSSVVSTECYQAAEGGIAYKLLVTAGPNGAVLQGPGGPGSTIVLQSGQQDAMMAFGAPTGFPFVGVTTPPNGVFDALGYGTTVSGHASALLENRPPTFRCTISVDFAG